MNSLPPFAANTNESDHPALESIAAYLDGRLPEAERSALTAHLDSCAACYEIYTESLRFQKEESAEARRAILPFERRKAGWMSAPLFRSIALPLAALLLMGVGAAVWYLFHLPLEPRSVESLTASLGSPNELTANLVEFDRMRGANDEPIVKHWAVAFQSGATLVDLQIAIDANDPDRMKDLAQNLRVLFGYVEFPLGADDQANVQTAVERFQEDRPVANALRLRLAALKSLERILRNNNGEELAPHFELGAWTEAGRLAAYGGRTAFFAAAENRKSLRWFRRHPPKPEVKDALNKIEDSWPESSLTPPAKKELTDQFEHVIEPYDVTLTEE